MSFRAHDERCSLYVLIIDWLVFTFCLFSLVLGPGHWCHSLSLSYRCFAVIRRFSLFCVFFFVHSQFRCMIFHLQYYVIRFAGFSVHSNTQISVLFTPKMEMLLTGKVLLLKKERKWIEWIWQWQWCPLRKLNAWNFTHSFFFVVYFVMVSIRRNCFVPSKVGICFQVLHFQRIYFGVHHLFLQACYRL